MHARTFLSPCLRTHLVLSIKTRQNRESFDQNSVYETKNPPRIVRLFYFIDKTRRSDLFGRQVFDRENGSNLSTVCSYITVNRRGITRIRDTLPGRLFWFLVTLENHSEALPFDYQCTLNQFLLSVWNLSPHVWSTVRSYGLGYDRCRCIHFEITVPNCSRCSATLRAISADFHENGILEIRAR